MIKGIKIEVCCGSVDDCLVAHRNGADRIELNSALELGGLTPSLATLKHAKQMMDTLMICMIRPRTAGFVYSYVEFETMKMDAKILLDNGADGIVFGFLNKDNTIDKERTKTLVELAHSYGKEAVFHKAFDQCIDLNQAIDDLIECKIDRILTSGGAVYPHILEGAEKLNQLIQAKGNQIEILPGGGVRPENIRQILQISKATQIHMTAKQEHDDHGKYVATDPLFLQEILKNI